MVTMAGTTTIIDRGKQRAHNRGYRRGYRQAVRQYYRKGHPVYRPIVRPAYPVVIKPRRSWVSFGVGFPRNATAIPSMPEQTISTEGRCSGSSTE